MILFSYKTSCTQCMFNNIAFLDRFIKEFVKLLNNQYYFQLIVLYLNGFVAEVRGQEVLFFHVIFVNFTQHAQVSSLLSFDLFFILCYKLYCIHMFFPYFRCHLLQIFILLLST